MGGIKANCRAREHAWMRTCMYVCWTDGNRSGGLADRSYLLFRLSFILLTDTACTYYCSWYMAII